MQVYLAYIQFESYTDKLIDFSVKQPNLIREIDEMKVRKVDDVLLGINNTFQFITSTYTISLFPTLFSLSYM